MFAALLCCALSGFAEETPIRLKKEELPNERSLVQSPTASINGQVLVISFMPTTTPFEISVMDTSGNVLYTGVYRAQEVAITLPSLPAGGYTLTIHVENCIYSGEFEIL